VKRFRGGLVFKAPVGQSRLSVCQSGSKAGRQAVDQPARVRKAAVRPPAPHRIDFLVVCLPAGALSQSAVERIWHITIFDNFLVNFLVVCLPASQLVSKSVRQSTRKLYS